MSKSYFSITVINPQDWQDFLESQDTLPGALTYDPTGAQAPTFNVAANTTYQQLFYESGAGFPPNGPANLIVTIDTVDNQGVEHRETRLYAGSVLNGNLFMFDPSKYPVISVLF